MAEEHFGGGLLGPLVGYHLRRASGAFAADFIATMEGTGMRQVLFAILATVSDAPGINQGTVGRILGIKRANMVALINELIDAKLVTRKTDPADRRAFLLHITAKGRTTLADALARVAAHEEKMLVGFTEAERETLLELLGRIERREPEIS
ncbi:MarR family transcriptional regulator [Sphingomonas sp.]|uniref:MarR family winged helix-turn-helix transcriptional regulator n=1 Tax=Sphingomonas sp. TaxID=28214 RepID=UPI001EBDFA1B|nr:MarR family transcriptional regulator [Sphingomonas sp.]MBX3592886.1 MarR family transcriptional regulator [Sphingomonas sp.]